MRSWSLEEVGGHAAEGGDGEAHAVEDEEGGAPGVGVGLRRYLKGMGWPSMTTRPDAARAAASRDSPARVCRALGEASRGDSRNSNHCQGRGAGGAGVPAKVKLAESISSIRSF